jgi:hypothetical protein
MIVKMFILLYSYSLMMAREVCAFLSPPPISPIAAASEDQKQHQDNKNEIHIFLQNIWRENSLLHVGAE